MGVNRKDLGKSSGRSENFQDNGGLSPWWDNGFGWSASRVQERGNKTRQLPGLWGTCLLLSSLGRTQITSYVYPEISSCASLPCSRREKISKHSRDVTNLESTEVKGPMEVGFSPKGQKLA